MTRRTLGLLVILALHLLVAPLRAEVPPAGKVPLTGVLMVESHRSSLFQATEVIR